MPASSVKLLLRNICKQALEQAREFERRDQRIEVSVVDDLTLQVKVYGRGNPLPAYLTVKITGRIT